MQPRRWFLALPLCGLIASTAPAQEPDNTGAEEPSAPWYRAELLVVQHSNAEATSTETWPPYPSLEYPQNYRFPIDPRLADQRLEAHPGAVSSIDDRGLQTLYLPPPDPYTAPFDPDAPWVDMLLDAQRPDSLLAPEPDLVATELEDPDETNETANKNEPGLDGVADRGEVGLNEAGLNELEMNDEQDPDITAELMADEPIPLPPAFRLLPDSALEFRGSTSRMSRSGDYAVLWHGAWLQPMEDKEASIGILLDRSADDIANNWPQLQGSIRLYLSRYLHVETALWLNTEGRYLPGEWHGEQPPLAPPSIVLTETPPPEHLRELLAMQAEALNDPPAQSEADSISDTGEYPVVSPAVIAPSTPPSGVPPLEAEVAEMTELEALEELEETEDTEAGPVWPWRHAVALQDSRRMRSAETHYIDHPLFGVVIRLTPLDEEAMRSWAEALDDPEWLQRHSADPDSPFAPIAEDDQSPTEAADQASSAPSGP